MNMHVLRRPTATQKSEQILHLYRALLRVAALTSYSAATPSAATRSVCVYGPLSVRCCAWLHQLVIAQPRPAQPRAAYVCTAYTRALLRVAAPTSYIAATPSAATHSAATRSVCVYGLYPRVAARGCAN